MNLYELCDVYAMNYFLKPVPVLRQGQEGQYNIAVPLTGCSSFPERFELGGSLQGTHKYVD
ncbi:unnamed protein product [Urochloa humidicola]